MEQVIDWLNENENRAFPLLENYSRKISAGLVSWDFPENLLLDLQLVVTDNTFSAQSIVKLKSLNCSSENVVVVFGTTTTTIAEFEIAKTVITFPHYVRTEAGNLAVFGEGIKNFITFYTSNALTEAVLCDIPVEPSRCTQFNNAWLGVNSISTDPEKITETLTYEPKISPLESIENNTVLDGDVKFLAGYNFRVNISEGLIDLEINSRYGLKMDCTTSFIQEQYLDCDELVSYINGIPPDKSGNFRLEAGVDMAVISGKEIASFNDLFSEQANQHTLFVGLSFETTNLCNAVNLLP